MQIVTSALPYIQDMVHLGNLIGSILPADIYYKYLVMKGEDAIFICGSDEHGSAIEIAALKGNVSPKQLADKNHERMKSVLEKYGCTFTYYGRTGTESNKKIVYDIFNALDKNGKLVEVSSEQPYCNVDKRFIPDRFIEGTCPYCGYEHARGDQCEKCGRLLNPKELINPHCNICGKSDITFKSVKNLALDLQGMQQDIKAFIERASASGNWSRNAVNNSLGYIARGLKSREVTRETSWGFPVPKKGYEDKVFYVWFDALIGYIGITYEYNGDLAAKYWLSKDTRLVQFMGKDNIEPHTLMWPAMLIGSNLGYALPSTIYAYEFLMWNGQKFSKSRHIGMNLEEALQALPGEYWRFALASILPETADTDFTIEVLQQAINVSLNDVLGNFLHRTLTMLKSNFESTVPSIGAFSAEAKAVLDKANLEKQAYLDYFERIQMREALHALISLAAIGNEYMSAKEPWRLLKENKQQEAKEVLLVCASIAHDVGILLYPFMPSASGKICNLFSTEPKIARLGEGVAGKALELSGLAPIFQKLTAEQIKQINSFS
ncbi:MAG: methionine--tRNA ligase [Candidatus Micrarchaeia archaeon]